MKKLDLTGHKYNRLTVLSFSHRAASKRNHYLCRCDCGNECIVDSGHLRSNHTKSCGCFKIETKHVEHGKSNSRVHSIWRGIKKRCYNKNCKTYCYYGDVGLTMSEEFREDFEAFYKEVGEPPDESRKWSVDRIDNNLGYVSGNLRWANPYQQSRNRALSSNNSSGYCGVRWVTSGKYNQTTSVVATWVSSITNKAHNRTFSVKKYGLLPAFAMAVDFRNKIIEEMNSQGAGYSDTHGKPSMKGQ